MGKIENVYNFTESDVEKIQEGKIKKNAKRMANALRKLLRTACRLCKHAQCNVMYSKRVYFIVLLGDILKGDCGVKKSIFAH